MPNVLNLSFAGNTVLEWLLAACWIALLTGATALLKPWLLARLSALSRNYLPRWHEALGYAVRATRVPLVGAMALGPVARELTLPPFIAPWIGGVAAAGLFVQAGLWLGHFVDHWIKTSRDRALRTDPETATGLAVASYIARVALWSLLLLVLLDNLGFNVTTLLAGLGVGGIAVGLALQNILGDLFSSLSIVLDKPFQIGHYVTIDDFSGTVENIGLKTTRIRSLTGELLVFSNTDLTKARLRNFGEMRERRATFDLTIAPDNPPERAQDVPCVIRELVEAQTRTRFERAHLKAVTGGGLTFETVYWMTTTDYIAFMDTQQAVLLGLLRQLRTRGIALAVPLREVRLSGESAQNPGKP